jgi:ankyrin repeat protein
MMSVLCSGQNGQVALHCAAKAGHAETVKLLVKLGANLNQKGRFVVLYASHTIECVCR